MSIKEKSDSFTLMEVLFSAKMGFRKGTPSIMPTSKSGKKKIKKKVKVNISTKIYFAATVT